MRFGRHEGPRPGPSCSWSRTDFVVAAVGFGAIAVGLALGVRHASPTVHDRGSGVVVTDARDCGRVLAPRCDWRRESVVTAGVTMAGVALCAAALARMRSRKNAGRRVSGSIAPPAPLGMTGALVQVALPVFVVGLGLVLLVYHLQLMERLGS